MKVLAFDTSTDACSVALAVDGRVLADHRVERQAHARLLLPMIESLLAQAQLTPAALDAIAFGRGPGSFTGVRIATAAAQGLALAADIGVVGVSTLAAIAQGCLRERGDRQVLVAVDARMGELYLGEFGADTADAAVAACDPGESVVSPEVAGPRIARLIERADVVFAGSGVSRFAPSFAGASAQRLRPDALPHAQDLLALAAERIAGGRLDDAADAVPVYLRDRVARTEAERAAGRSAGQARP